MNPPTGGTFTEEANVMTKEEKKAMQSGNIVMIVSALWHSILFSRYFRGELTEDSSRLINKIYWHPGKKQIRIYSYANLHHAEVSVNGRDPVTLKKRGRFGRLYIGEE